MHEIVANSGLGWTIVRFLRRRRDTKAHGLKHVGFFGEDGIGCTATETDLARFTASQVVNSRYIGAAPAVSN